MVRTLLIPILIWDPWQGWLPLCTLGSNCCAAVANEPAQLLIAAAYAPWAPTGCAMVLVYVFSSYSGDGISMCVPCVLQVLL